MAKIVKRGKTFYVDYRWPATRAGKRRRVKVGPDKKAAKVILGQVEAEMMRGMHPTLGTIKPIPFSEAADRFMAEYVKVECRNPQPFENNQKILVAHFGDVALASITRAEVNRYRTLRLQEPKKRRGTGTVSKSTINREVAFLQKLFTWARDEVGIFAGDNPCRGMRYEEPKPNRDHYLTREQADAFLASAPDHLKLIAGFMFEVGSRIGETLLLEWRDIDLTHGREQVIFRAETTKSGKERSVALTPTAVAVLREAGKVRSTMHNAIFTFKGQPVTKVQTSWNTTCRKAGLPKSSPHIARHSAATWAREAGADLGWLQDVLGHSSAIYTQRYAKPTDAYRRSGVGRMGRNPAGGHAVDTKTTVDASESAS